MIGSYLDALSAELRVPRRARDRIVAETRDHLVDAVAAGQTEEEAVAAFGEARQLAARFHEQLASSSAQRAAGQTVLLAIAFGIGVAAAFGSSNIFPLGIVVFVGAQLAAVAGALALVRWLRYRSAPLVPSARLGDLYRTGFVVVGAVAVVGIAEMVNGLPIAGGVMLAAALVVGVRIRAAVARARVLLPPAPSTEDVLDDVVAVLPQLEPVAKWVPLRRNPWRVCLLFAVACGVALAGWHGVVEAGGPVTFANFGRAMLAGLVIASIEATAVIACFAAFARPLGIRR
jgi:HAAS